MKKNGGKSEEEREEEERSDLRWNSLSPTVHIPSE
jgi:hypothetical protein